MTAAADDQMIVQSHADRGQRRGDLFGRFDIGGTRARIARGMVMGKYGDQILHCSSRSQQTLIKV